MDASIATQATGIEAWLTSNGALIQLVLYGAQFLFWIAMIVFIGYAVATYKRWVNFQMGVGHSGKLRTEAAATADSVAAGEGVKEAISVEEFVD